MSRELINAQMNERGELFSQIRSLLDIQEKRELNKEETDKLTELFTLADDLKEKADKENQKLIQRKKLEEYESAFGASKPKLLISTPAGVTDQYESEEVKAKKLEEKQRQGMRLYFREQITLKEAAELYDLRVDTKSQGGYLASPQFMVNEVLQDLRDALVLRQICTVLPPLPKPGELSQNTLTKMGRPFRGVGERKIGGYDTTLMFGRRTMYTHPMDQGIIASRDFLNFSDWPAEAMIRQLANESLVDEQELEAVLGDGKKKGLGLFVPDPDGISASRDFTTGHTSGTQVHVDALLYMPDKLPQNFLINGQCGYLMHRSIKTALRVVKANTAGSYLWQPSLTAGTPDLFNGWPVYTSDKCPSTISSGSYVALFGNMKEYQFLDAAAVEWFMDPYSRSGTREVVFQVRIYTDSQPRREMAFTRSKMP